MRKSRRYVLDAFALFSYIEGEQGARVVADILKAGINGKAEIFMSVINWGEIYYITLREQGVEAAKLYLETINRYPITVINVDKQATLEAAEFKALYKMSYADAFAVSLAKSKKANLVTGDREFSSVKEIINIVWL